MLNRLPLSFHLGPEVNCSQTAGMAWDEGWDGLASSLLLLNYIPYD